MPVVRKKGEVVELLDTTTPIVDILVTGVAARKSGWSEVVSEADVRPRESNTGQYRRLPSHVDLHESDLVLWFKDSI